MDDFTKRVWIYFCREKSEALHWVKMFKAEAEKQSDKKINF